MTKEKSEFIGNYLDKKMKGNTLPYGMDYLNMVSELEDEAEKLWKRNKKNKSNDKRKRI